MLSGARGRDARMSDCSRRHTQGYMSPPLPTVQYCTAPGAGAVSSDGQDLFVRDAEELPSTVENAAECVESLYLAFNQPKLRFHRKRHPRVN